MINIEELVSKAKTHIGDEKEIDIAWCNTDEIIALLENGAIPKEINKRLVEGKAYLQVVFYEGAIFSDMTKEPIQELEKYSYKIIL